MTTSGRTQEKRIEKLHVPFESNFEIRKTGEGTSDGLVYVDGFWAVFGTVNWYDEILLKGSADATILERGPKTDPASGKRSSKIKMLWQHLSDEVLGLPEKLEEQDYGIWASTPVRLKDRNGNWVQKRIDYLDQVEAGEVDSFSIGFIADEIEYVWRDDVEDADRSEPPGMWDWFFGDAIRIVKKLTLFEGSLVTFPAEENALVDRAAGEHQVALALRSMTEEKQAAFIERFTGLNRDLVKRAMGVLTELDQALVTREEGPGEGPGDEEETPEPQGDPADPEELDDEELAASLEQISTNLSLATMENRMRRIRN